MRIIYGVMLCRVIIGLGRAMLCTGNARKEKRKEKNNKKWRTHFVIREIVLYDRVQI